MHLQPRTLEDVRARLMDLLRSDSKFNFVNTRLILQTGVDLRDTTPDDEQLVPEVTAALEEMGFAITDTRGSGDR